MIGKFPDQHVADGQFQYRIAQKLKPLVVSAGGGVGFVDKGTVCQGIVQQTDVREVPAEVLFQRDQRAMSFLLQGHFRYPVNSSFRSFGDHISHQ